MAATEIMRIERNAHFRLEPGAINRLAETFALPNLAMLQLSGNSAARPGMQELALRFAAPPGARPQKLTFDEQRAREEFIAYLENQPNKS